MTEDNSVKVINFDGVELQNLPPNEPYLLIRWIKSNGSTHLLRAILNIPSLKTMDSACPSMEVNLTTSVAYIEGGEIKGYGDTTRTKFLPYLLDKDKGCTIPLDAQELLDDISLNVWTKLKDGTENLLKAYPSSIVCKCPKILHFSLCKGNNNPCSLSFPFISSSKDNEVCTVIILLE